MTSLTVTSAVQLAARLRAGACGDPGFMYDGAASPRAPESPEGSSDDPHIAEKRLAAGLMLASAKKRRKQSKPVRIHALDETEGDPVPLALTPRAEPEQLACLGGERAASTGESGSDLPLNLSSQWRERETAEIQGQPPVSQLSEQYGYKRDGESHAEYRSSQRRESVSQDLYRTNFARGSESQDDYRTNQRRESESHESYRTNQRRGSESNDDNRIIQRRDSHSSTGLEDYRVGQTRDGEHQEDFRHGQRRDSGLSCPEDSRGRQSEQDALQTLSSLQRKFSTPGYLPYGPPPLLLPFLSQQMGQPPAAPADGKIFNPEAFCELCGKEFCNKYFLRTHKANKHGVFADAPRSPPAGSALLAQQLAASGRQLSPSAESRDSGRPSSETEAAARPASDTFCQPCQKEFCDAFFLRQHRAAAHGETEHPEEAPRPPVYRAPREPEQGELTRPEPSDPYDARQLSELPAPAADGREGESPRRFSREQLRLMGVTNADAFCNICCKEFCNKYFLKVHRYKMHQIGSPPPERERPPSSGASGGGGGGVGSSSSNSGSSAAPPVSCPPLEKLLEAPLRDSFPRECDQCGRPFQSSYLLQMHKYYFHGLGQQFAGGLMPTSDRPPPPPPPPPKKSKSKKKDNFGDDLKKLQGMIKGLHDKKNETTSCHVCAKTLENKTALQAHLMTEHGMFQSQEEIVIPKPPAPSTPKASSGSKDRTEKTQSSNSGETFCSICKKDFYAKFFLQQHMQTAHGIQAGATLSETAFLARIRREVESQKKPERPKPASTSRSYCEICKKELCNKYFMKTHMTKMHGINLEAHQSRGGATCDVCQKELCSRYFLQVHKQNCHGIRDTAAEPDPRILEETSKDEEGLEICNICTGKFKTPKLLEQHMIGEHGAPKEKKSKSSSSSSSSSAAAAAAVAAASAAAQLPSIGPTCNLCSQTLPDLLSLRLHMLQAHPLPEQPAPETGSQTQPGAEDAKVSSLWMRDKLLRYPFGPFPGGFPPFLPGLLPQLAAPPSDTPFPLLPFDMPPGLLAQRAAAAAAAAAAAVRSPEEEKEAPPESSTSSSTSAAAAAGTTAATATIHWAAPGSSGGLASESETPATAVKPEQPTSEEMTPRRRQTTTAPRLHRCAPCGLRFRRRVHFLQHWQQRHGRSRPEGAAAAAIVNAYLKRRQRCRRCGFAARGRGTLLRHERRHHRHAAPPTRCLYSLPLPASTDTPYRMQSFVMSSTSADGEGVIASALTALPTMQPLPAPAELNVQLLPV